ncbi:hypothetical protein JHN59_00185 [Streptomyces sp. MBT49]|uniref:hypothetical protein n=1 Tax=unclassified Streptomyces TaxID=2593676 RepID=UPI00190CD898|nr:MULTISPECIES: hypothetical protein [unclassified Streptomyces]MBK3623294.1 hypothetical protein [Streptomyces sp. MBT49]MBK3642320.1 hypothetical protein [Streptomyces sp. MBT33]
MPATVVTKPLSVHFVLPDGTQWTARLEGLPNPRLARDLALGMAENTHPTGAIGKKRVAEYRAVALRQMVKKLSAAGFTGAASDLTRPVLMRYWLAGTRARESETRLLLKGFDQVTGGLRPDVRAYLAGAPIQANQVTEAHKAYTDGEWERLEASCRTRVDDIWARHRRLLAAAGQGMDPRVSGRHSEEDIAWLMLRDGPLSFENGYREYVGGYVPQRAGDPVRAMVGHVREGLFPTRPVQIAYALLFGVYSGVVPDGIDGIGLGGIDWAGDTTVLLTYLKGRTARESLNLADRAVHLLERWLEFSAPLRRFAPAALRDRLWLAFALPGGFVGTAPTGLPQRALVRDLGLVDDTGKPLAVHRGRIRATYEERLARRGWTGRATIDPNHTPRTEGDHYVTPTTPAQLDAVESIIEDGMSDVLRKALPPVVLTSEKAAEFAEGFPDEMKRLGLDADAVRELVGGERDVFTAACADQLAGVHGPAGQPCPARPWVCLLCPLAVFLPRHAANLLRLDAFFARQFRQMPTENYLRVFGPYADRLTREILPKLSAEAKAKGEQDVANDDGTELPLRPEEITA